MTTARTGHLGSAGQSSSKPSTLPQQYPAHPRETKWPSAQRLMTTRPSLGHKLVTNFSSSLRYDPRVARQSVVNGRRGQRRMTDADCNLMQVTQDIANGVKAIDAGLLMTVHE